MPDQVPGGIKAARSRKMRQLGARQTRAFHRRFVGSTLPVLWESARGDDAWHGLTDNYLSVTTTCTENLANCITPTRLVEAAGQALRGEVILAEMI
jgi:tRNA A37 methylthiotransferase MiaB